MEAKTTPASFINAKPCRNDPQGYGCPCSTGTCLCTPLASYGSDRNICGCWPEPYTAPRKRPRFCKCGAPLTVFERRHGLQCGACTRRDEAFYGAGCGL